MTPHSCNTLHRWQFELRLHIPLLERNAIELRFHKHHTSAHFETCSRSLTENVDQQWQDSWPDPLDCSFELHRGAGRDWEQPRAHPKRPIDEVQRSSAILAKERNLVCVAQSLPKSHRGPHYPLLYGSDLTMSRSDGSDTVKSKEEWRMRPGWMNTSFEIGRLGRPGGPEWWRMISEWMQVSSRVQIHRTGWN